MFCLGVIPVHPVTSQSNWKCEHERILNFYHSQKRTMTLRVKSPSVVPEDKLTKVLFILYVFVNMIKK